MLRKPEPFSVRPAEAIRMDYQTQSI